MICDKIAPLAASSSALRFIAWHAILLQSILHAL